MNYVSQPAAPLYDMGALLPLVEPRSVQTVRQPAYPLYDGGLWGLAGFGAAPSGSTILAASAPIISSVAAPIISSSITGIAVGAGSIAGPVGAGIAVLVGVIAGLWAAHSARVKGAKAENQAINSAVQAWDAGMKAIFAAANSSDPTQNVSAADAANQVEQLFGTFWAQMSPYMHSPGTADASGAGTHCGNGTLMAGDPCSGTPGSPAPCGKSCTATCCVGCADLYPSMLQALQVLASPTGGSVKICTVFGSSYGAQLRSGYTLTYTPPTVASTVSSVTSGIESLFGGSSAAGTSSWLPILAIGAAAFFLLR